MLRFYAPQLIWALNHLTVSAMALTLIQDEEDRARSQEDIKHWFRKFGDEMGKAPASNVLALQYNRIKDFIDAEDFNPSSVHVMVREFCINYTNELASTLFLSIPASHREYFESSAPFGKEVQNKYPEAERDILSAGRCLALDEWTATVFHLMRALEHGLRDMARHVAIPMTAVLEQESWGKIIDQIEKEIGRREKLKKDDPLRGDLKFYSEVASNFRYFKNAWRNHVSHAKDHYNEREALTIWNHVRTFMQVLAMGPS